MARYLASRVPSALLVLLLASVVVFSILRLIPGDPATNLAGPDATPEAIAAIRADLGLDRPMVEQYLTWVRSLVTGDLGRSYVVGVDIGGLVADGLANTLVLTAAALLIAIVLALLASIGGVLADRPWLNAVLSVANTVAVALPTFVTGTLLIVLLAVTFRLLPAGGTPPLGFTTRPDLAAQYLLMPAICLALPVAAALSRFLTEALRTELAAPYVTTARALGISPRRIVLTQALPNALPSAVTVLGLQTGALLGGAVLVEAIFAWPGLGQLIEQGIAGRDYPLVQVLMMLAVLVFVVIQLLTDLANAALDPRIRLGGAA